MTTPFDRWQEVATERNEDGSLKHKELVEAGLVISGGFKEPDAEWVSIHAAVGGDTGVVRGLEWLLLLARQDFEWAIEVSGPPDYRIGNVGSAHKTLHDAVWDALTRAVEASHAIS